MKKEEIAKMKEKREEEIKRFIKNVKITQQGEILIMLADKFGKKPNHYYKYLRQVSLETGNSWRQFN